MAVQAAIKDSFTFVGGLNTEGGFFVTPENSWKEGVNVTPNVDGSISRRNGVDYESNYSLFSSAITPDQKDLWAFTTGIWTTVAGNGNVDFIVAQTGPTLHFYSGATGNVSGTKKAFTINLDTYKAVGNVDVSGTAICSFASTYGKLIVTSKNTDPIVVTYDVATDTITTALINLQVRDFKGKDTGAEISAEYTEAEWIARGQTLADVKYNLYNQGWTDDKLTSYLAANSNKYPANTKQWIYGKDTSDDFQPAFLNKQDFGNSPAPKGHFVIAAFPNTVYRPTTCAFFAGRVWYAGLPSTNELGSIYFSQVLDTFTKIGNCLQTNDPTSEVFSDLQDDDGGTIQIPEAGEILSLQPLGRGVMVLATNGVWFVSGINLGFTAASYSVERVSTVGCISSKSILLIEDSLTYWSTSGIYAISPGQSGAEFTSKNVSDQNIKTFFSEIPVLSKVYAEGSYNATNKTAYWLYTSNLTTTTSNGKFNKDHILAVDLRLNSWYWFSFNTAVGSIPVSIEITKETSETDFIYNVVAGADNVLAGADTVQATLPVISGTEKTFKFLTLHPDGANYSLTFSDLSNARDSSTKFKDWYSADNDSVEEDCYFITGYVAGGNGPSRVKTGQYLTVFMKRTETAFDANTNPLNVSGCLMQSRWDFTDNNIAGKWADEVQVYRQLRSFFASPNTPFVDGYPLVISKNKLRGRGKAIQFKFSSEDGKDMKIVGWSGTFVGNTNV
jgi:hypothetical protein